MRNYLPLEYLPISPYLTEVLIFATANTFFQLNQLFIAHSCTGFCPGLLWKHELNLRSSNWSCSVKKGALKFFANFTEKHLCWSFCLIEFRSSYRRSSTKRPVLKSFAIFTEKRLCWSLLLTKLQTFRPATLQLY